MPPPIQAPPVQASYYQQTLPPHASQSQPPFANASLPKPPPTNSHHHHHHQGGHHHHHHHHHHHPQSGPPAPPPNSTAAGSSGMEYSHTGPSSSLGSTGDRYYSNEPRGPSPSSNSHLHHNGQSSSRREHRSSGEMTPGRGPPGPSPHGGSNMGALEHGMPPPPPTTLASGHGRYSSHRDGYGHSAPPSAHHGHYGNNVNRTENGEDVHWERRRRSDSVRSERDREREMPAEDHREDHDERA